MYTRLLKKVLIKRLFQGKVLIMTGARQTGKTTLIKNLLAELPDNQKGGVKSYNGDDPSDRDLLNNRGLDFLKTLVGTAKIIFIDEGQKIPTIGQTLKLLVDHFGADRQIIVTGSSSVHLLNNTQEALTGRKFVFMLYPLSWEEMWPDHDYAALLKNVEIFLVYGQYPEIAAAESFTDKREKLKNLTSSYLYKDILELNEVKNAPAITAVLKALALQIGNEVSYTEISRLVGINKKTVARYIALLEQAYVVFHVPPYTGNKRIEISKLKKIYFYDLGIRNALLNNFNDLKERADVGALWENALMIERMKFREYHNIAVNQYFWRAYGGGEVDLVEEAGGQLRGYEFKWSGKQRRPPSLWATYPHSSYQIIDKEKLTGFVF